MVSVTVDHSIASAAETAIEAGTPRHLVAALLEDYEYETQKDVKYKLVCFSTTSRNNRSTLFNWLFCIFAISMLLPAYHVITNELPSYFTATTATATKFVRLSSHPNYCQIRHQNVTTTHQYQVDIQDVIATVQCQIEWQRAFSPGVSAAAIEAQYPNKLMVVNVASWPTHLTTLNWAMAIEHFTPELFPRIVIFVADISTGRYLDYAAAVLVERGTWQHGVTWVHFDALPILGYSFTAKSSRSNAYKFGQPNLQLHSWLKVWFIRHFLQQGAAVLVSNSDVIMPNNPIPFLYDRVLESDPNHMKRWVMCDDRPTPKQPHKTVNTDFGLWLPKHLPFVEIYWRPPRRWIDIKDQEWLNDLERGYTRLRVPKKAQIEHTCMPLDEGAYRSGSACHHFSALRDSKTIAFHFNCLPDEAAKQKLMLNTSTWFAVDI